MGKIVQYSTYTSRTPDLKGKRSCCSSFTDHRSSMVKQQGQIQFIQMSSQANVPLQRRLIVRRYSPNEVTKRDIPQNFQKIKVELLGKMINDPELYTVETWQEALDLAQRCRYRYYSGAKILTIKKEDPIYDIITAEIEENQRRYKYKPDALYEYGRIRMGKSDSVKSQSWARCILTCVFGNWRAPQKIVIDRIVAIIDRQAEARFRAGARGYGGGIEPLYQGHLKGAMDILERVGPNPSYVNKDRYSSTVGHGALGRGEYYTPIVNKAILYSPQEIGRERSFFRSYVRRGSNPLITSSSEFRQSPHNGMVQDPDTKRLNGFGGDSPREGIQPLPTSIEGRKGWFRHPGEGLFMLGLSKVVETIMPSSFGQSFDSNEVLIRNKNQIIQGYRIYFHTE